MAISPEALGWWALQFTPRVALMEEAVVLEVQASERLFGGLDGLLTRIQQGGAERGLRALALANTAGAALALARSTEPGGATPVIAEAPIEGQLAPLPLTAISAVGAHAETLQRLGCRTLGDVLKLPRGGLSRRFGADLLHALDAALGLRPQAFEWLTLPPVFLSQRELPWRVDDTEALHGAFLVLLHELGAWLAGHQAATETLALRWCHEWARHGDDRWCEHAVRLAEATADVSRLSRMVKEHLTRMVLSAPVTDIGLRVDSLVPQTPDTLELFQLSGHGNDHSLQDGLAPAAQRAQRTALLNLLDRLSVRLGPERVLVGQLLSDHRLAHRQCWQPAVQHLASHSSLSGAKDTASRLPHPTWLLPRPLPLALSPTATGLSETPVYQGALRLLAGPHRIEAGWWDSRIEAPLEARDHHLASSPEAGLLWVYRERHPPQDGRSPWFLHGFFA